MSTEWWTDLVCSLAVLAGAYNVWLILRVLTRMRRQIARLTRRVWMLEGKPRGDA